MRRLLGGYVAVAAIAACDSDLPPASFETPHFRLYAYADDPVCADLGDVMESHYEVMTEYLGVELEDGEKIDVYKYRDLDELAGSGECPEEAGGCAGHDEAFVASTVSDPFEHELVHTYAALNGDAPLIFEEGLATMLQDYDGLGIGAAPATYEDVALEDVMESSEWLALKDRPYAAAASFVRSLVDRHGIDAFMSFHAATPRDASRSDIDAAFETAFGESLDAALSAWRDSGAKEGWLPIQECAAPPVVLGEAWPSDAFVCVNSTRTLSLDSDEGIVAAAQHDGGAFLSIRSCTGERTIWPAEWSLVTAFPDPAAKEELWAALGAGHYYVAAAAPAGDPAAGSFMLERAATQGETCDGAAEREIPDDTAAVVVPVSFSSASDDGGDGSLMDVYVRFTVSSMRKLTVDVHPPDAFAADTFADGKEHRTHVALCSDGCAAPCADLAGAGAPLSAGQSYALLLEGTSSDNRTFTLTLDP